MEIRSANELLSPPAMKALELAEAAYWRSYLLACTTLPETAPFVQLASFGEETVAGLLREHDILAFNRCLGLGMSQPVNERQIDQIKAFYTEAGISRFFIPVFPDESAADIQTILRAKGLRHYNNWTKLYRPADEPIAEKNTALTLRYATPEDRHTYARIVSAAFQWPPAVGYYFASTIGTANWYHYLCQKDAKPIAVAALFVNGHVGALALGATLPEYRNQGAQTVMIQQRIRDAREKGCTLLSTETAENRPQSPSRSYQNLLRQGFRFGYLRPNYLFQY